MRKAEKIFMTLLMTVFILGVFSLSAKAEEISVTEMNQVMTIMNDCEARELPDDGATAVQIYKTGESVWVIGETQNGWYKISYQEKEGYIPKESAMKLQVEIEGQGMMDLVAAGLDSELAAAEAEGKMLVEEVERQRAETRRSRIWTVVIVILIIGIFVTGIVSTVKKEKDGGKKEDDKKDTGKKSSAGKSAGKDSKAADKGADDFDYYFDDDDEDTAKKDTVKKDTEKKDADLIDLDLNDEE